MGIVASQASFSLSGVVGENKRATEFFMAFFAVLLHSASFLEPHSFGLMGVVTGCTAHDSPIDRVVVFLSKGSLYPCMAGIAAFLDRNLPLSWIRSRGWRVACEATHFLTGVQARRKTAEPEVFAMTTQAGFVLSGNRLSTVSKDECGTATASCMGSTAWMACDAAFCDL
jgi:hypothetical protein